MARCCNTPPLKRARSASVPCHRAAKLVASRFIAFRSLTPLLVSTLDTLVRGEPRPSVRTMLTLFAIAVGAGSYAYDDANFSVTGYAWAIAYLVIIVSQSSALRRLLSSFELSPAGHRNGLCQAYHIDD